MNKYTLLYYVIVLCGACSVAKRYADGAIRKQDVGSRLAQKEVAL